MGQRGRAPYHGTANFKNRTTDFRHPHIHTLGNLRNIGTIEIRVDWSLNIAKIASVYFYFKSIESDQTRRNWFVHLIDDIVD
jgi:hypothetical protein